MEHYEVLTTVWFWILMAAITALHITAIFARGLGKGILTAVCGINMVLHLVLIGFMLINAAEPQELFFALLLSSTTALITTRRRGKGADGNGI